MSNKPNPAATLTAVLFERTYDYSLAPKSGLYRGASIHEIASLASDLCRLAPAIERRNQLSRLPVEEYKRENDKSHGAIEAKRAQLARRLIKLNVKLAPFSLIASGYAGGGLYLGISSTDASRPLDMIVGA